MNKKKPYNGNELDNALVAELKRVGTELIKNQQPLGDEFAKVLNEKRMELYEDDAKGNK